MYDNSTHRELSQRDFAIYTFLENALQVIVSFMQKIMPRSKLILRSLMKPQDDLLVVQNHMLFVVPSEKWVKVTDCIARLAKKDGIVKNY
ncbi:hypothetical protein TNIN_174851 [Trichonephila inaurata madagascariensis]|uniref:Uncharacterized protein n=1 Tax=Trichonephila inaurata madagascariensis TaxID=2747483 RepID=A0A8X7C5H8_9ARAC|nr:hypothetical protein TNIN_174851 [Trichonephila inaurata madagascariensis]